MRARLVILYGLWAIVFDAGRPRFTSYKSSVPAGKVLRVVRRDNPDVNIVVGQLELFDAA